MKIKKPLCRLKARVKHNLRYDLLMKLNHIGLAIIVAILWGFNFVVMKSGLHEMPQFLFSGLRFLLTSVPLIFLIPKPKTSWAVIIGIGICQGFLSFALLFKGMNLGVPAGLSSLLLQGQVLFSIGLSFLMLNIKPTKQQLIGVIVASIGLILVATSLHYEVVTYYGILFVMAGAFFWAVSNILLKYAGPVDSFALVIWSCLFSAIVNLAFSVSLEGVDLIITSCQNITWKGLSALAYIVVMATWVGATLQTKLICRYSPTIVAPFSLLIPLVSMFSGYIVLDEHLTIQTMAAACVVFLGLAINQWSSRQKISEYPYTKETLSKVA